MAKLVSNKDNNEWTINLDLVQIIKLDDKEIRFYFDVNETCYKSWYFRFQDEAEIVYKQLQAC